MDLCVCVDNRKFACDWPDCRKSFLHAENLTSHRRQHTEPKPFRCEQCPLAYWQKSSLRSHRLKTHGHGHGQTSTTAITDSNIVNSTQLLANGSSAGQLVDGIIRSVTASVQDASIAVIQVNSSSMTPPVSDISEGSVVRPPTLTDSQHVGGLATERSQLSTELVSQAGKELAQHSVSELMDSARGEGIDVIHCQDTLSRGNMSEPLSTAQMSEPLNVDPPSSAKLSEPLNVYEFCEDETVDIHRPKPARGSVAVPRASIELSQSTIDLPQTNRDDDDDDHDLTAFDDDMSPTVDRLAETVITYSRKKKHSSSDSENLPAKFGKSSSPLKHATKKSSKRKLSVAGQKRKRTGVAELEEVREEPVKKKLRRKRTVENDVGSDAVTRKELSKGSMNVLSQQRSVTRSTKRSQHDKTSADNRVMNNDSRAKKLSADDDIDSVTLKNSSLTAGGHSKKRRRKSNMMGTVEHHKCTEAVKTTVRNVDIDCNITEQLGVTATGWSVLAGPHNVTVASASPHNTDHLTVESAGPHNASTGPHKADHVTVASSGSHKAERVSRRKVKSRKTRTTRHSSRNDVQGGDIENEDDEFAAQRQSPFENIDSAANIGCNLSEEDVDTSVKTGDVAVGPAAESACNHSEMEMDIATSSLHECDSVDVKQSDAGPAAECLSDNTEILSLNDNADDADDGEYTRRSSPASYKSEEREPCLMLPAQQDNDDSRGNYSTLCTRVSNPGFPNLITLVVICIILWCSSDKDRSLALKQGTVWEGRR